MKDKPGDIYQLLRRAVATQVEMGMGELIVKKNNEAEKPAIVPQKEVAAVVSVQDMFTREMMNPKSPRFDSLEAHFEAISNCQLCPLGQTRNKFVYGVGNAQADLMFIGEAPGVEEDRLGEPFVGRAGQLLDRILTAIQFTRQDVYIGNILKCRPPDNRDPAPEEMDRCFPHLLEQIRLIRPKLICALGRVAAQMLLRTNAPLGKLRGRWHDFQGIPTLVTYHPAALLRFASYKKETWADMQILKARYDEMT